MKWDQRGRSGLLAAHRRCKLTPKFLLRGFLDACFFFAICSARIALFDELGEFREGKKVFELGKKLRLR